jgi:hypothetical protein
MGRYFARTCPRCNGYLEIRRELKSDMRLLTLSGGCVRCTYRVRWIVISGGAKHLTRQAVSRGFKIKTWRVILGRNHSNAPYYGRIPKIFS